MFRSWSPEWGECKWDILLAPRRRCHLRESESWGGGLDCGALMVWPWRRGECTDWTRD